MKFPADVYYRVVNIAESYYVLQKRLIEFEKSIFEVTPHNDGQPRGNQVSDPTALKAELITKRQEECSRKIKAIERALSPLGPVYRDFIKLNFFEHKDIQSIDSPMSLQEKKDVRKFFLIKVARNLNEI